VETEYLPQKEKNCSTPEISQIWWSEILPWHHNWRNIATSLTDQRSKRVIAWFRKLAANTKQVFEA
jgi:hypothetical protein